MHCQYLIAYRNGCIKSKALIWRLKSCTSVLYNTVLKYSDLVRYVPLIEKKGIFVQYSRTSMARTHLGP